MHKLLLVEDEKNFAHVLRDYLGMSGFEVLLAENGEDGLQLFSEHNFSLCILDVMMPKKDGFSLGSEIRARNKDIPMIYLTARGSREDMLKGYRTGADDYIIKPVDSEVLLLKIQAILSRNAHAQNPTHFEHRIGNFHFNAKLRTLRLEDREIKLSPKEAALLHLLCLHRNDLLPREKALKQIWKEDNYFTGRSMDVYIVKLRKHLAADNRISLNNLHGGGYSLTIKE